MIWAFVAALALLFWVPDLILYMGWAKFWIQFTTQVFIWSLFGVSFNLLMGYAGMISFGQAAYLGIGGYTAGLLLKNIPGLSFYLGLAAAPVGGALAALIIGYFCVRRTHIYFAILTLAFGHIVYLIAFKWYGFTGGDNGLIGIPVPAWIAEPTFANYYKFVLVISRRRDLPLVAHRQLAVRPGAHRHPRESRARRLHRHPGRSLSPLCLRPGRRLLRPGRRPDHGQRPQRLSRPGALDAVDPGAADEPAGRRLHLLRPDRRRPAAADDGCRHHPELSGDLAALPGRGAGADPVRPAGRHRRLHPGARRRQRRRPCDADRQAGAPVPAQILDVLRRRAAVHDLLQHPAVARRVAAAADAGVRALRAGDLGHRAVRAAAARRRRGGAVAAAAAGRAVQLDRRGAAADPCRSPPSLCTSISARRSQAC